MKSIHGILDGRRRPLGMALKEGDDRRVDRSGFRKMEEKGGKIERLRKLEFIDQASSDDNCGDRSAL